MEQRYADEQLLPNVSELERRFDPLSRATTAKIRELIPRAEELVDARNPGLSPERRTEDVIRLSRLLYFNEATDRKRSLQEGLNPVVRGIALGPGAIGEVEPPASSLLDLTPFSGLRNVENVKGLLPVVGATAAQAIPIVRETRRMADPVQRALGGVIDPTIRMLRQRGQELTAGVLGAAAGGVMSERLDRAADYVNKGGDPGVFKAAPVIGAFIVGRSADSRPDAFVDYINRAMQEATLEAGGFGVGQAAGTAFRKAGQILAGDEALLRRLVQDAQELGVPVGIIDASNSRAARMTRSALNVFGLTGDAFRGPLARRAGDVDRAATRLGAGLSDDLAQIVRMGDSAFSDQSQLVARLNRGAYKRFARSFEIFKGQNDALWADFIQKAEAAGTTLRPASTRTTAARELAKFFGVGKAGKGKGMPRFFKPGAEAQTKGLTREEIEELASEVYDRDFPTDGDLALMRNILDKVSRLEETPGLLQMDALSKQIKVHLEGMQTRTGKGVLMSVLTAIKEDVGKHLVDAAPDVLEAQKRAARHTETWLTLLTGKMGQKVARVSGDFGQQKVQFVPNPGMELQEGEVLVKNAGQVTPTQFIDRMTQELDVDLAEQMRGILSLSGQRGFQTYRDMVARRIQKAFSASFVEKAGTGIPYFDGKRLFSALKLDDPASAERAGLIRAYELAGGNPGQLLKLARLAQNVFADGLNNPSTFAARRAALAGIGGALGATGVRPQQGDDGISLTATAASALALYAIGTGSGRLLTNPDYMRPLLKLLDPAAGNAAWIRATRRLASNGLLGTKATVDRFFDSLTQRQAGDDFAQESEGIRQQAQRDARQQFQSAAAAQANIQ